MIAERPAAAASPSSTCLTATTTTTTLTIRGSGGNGSSSDSSSFESSDRLLGEKEAFTGGGSLGTSSTVSTTATTTAKDFCMPPSSEPTADEIPLTEAQQKQQQQEEKRPDPAPETQKTSNRTTWKEQQEEEGGGIELAVTSETMSSSTDSAEETPLGEAGSAAEDEGAEEGAEEGAGAGEEDKEKDTQDAVEASEPSNTTSSSTTDVKEDEATAASGGEEEKAEEAVASPSTAPTQDAPTMTEAAPQPAPPQPQAPPQVAATTPATTTTTANAAAFNLWTSQPRTAIKVIKGEIHNVLTVMRADQRYVSARRFTEELVSTRPSGRSGGGRSGGTSSYADTWENSFGKHPVAQQLHQLHATLTLREQSGVFLNQPMPVKPDDPSMAAAASLDAKKKRKKRKDKKAADDGTNPFFFLEPFCEAVQRRDMSAPVTGAALAALHKFIVYGFVHPDQHQYHPIMTTEDPNRRNRHNPAAGMSRIAHALLQCTFEESLSSSSSSLTGANGASSTISSSGNGGGGGENSGGGGGGGGGGSFTLNPVKARRSLLQNSSSKDGVAAVAAAASGAGGGASTLGGGVWVGGPQDDEKVVLQLLEVVSLVVRTSLPDRRRRGDGTGCLISRVQLLGLVGTCLHVSHKALRAGPLLKAAAGMALSQVVLDVFGAAAGIVQQHNNTALPSSPNQPPFDPRTLPDPDYDLLVLRTELWTQIVRLLNPEVTTNSNTTGTPSLGVGSGSSSSGNNSGPTNNNNGSSSNNNNNNIVLTSRQDPRNGGGGSITASSLTLINMALEVTISEKDLTRAEIHLLQTDLCKYLLQWSNTHDLLVLQLTLRVIFNLFQTLRNYLKIPLEVFLTSVHLRILLATSTQTKPLIPSSSHNHHHKFPMITTTMATAEEQEVALESLLEFCQEPTLMQDLYLNYDCDIACTNLFESIVLALAHVATPRGYGIANGGNMVDEDDVSVLSGDHVHQPLPPHLQTGAATGPQHHLLKDAGPMPDTSNNSRASFSSARGSSSGGGERNSAVGGGSAPGGNGPMLHGSVHGSSAQQVYYPSSQTPVHATAPLNHLHRLAMEGLLVVMDAIDKRCLEREERLRQQQDEAASPNSGDAVSTTSSDDEMELPEPGSGMTDQELHDRKLVKYSLARVARAFNAEQNWKKVAIEEHIMKDESAAEDAAHILYNAPGVSKERLGHFLSKPEEDFPFEAEVRSYFVTLFNFKHLNFAHSLRKYLSKFRLPGEAQCIDRLMEAFSTQLFKQQGRRNLFKNSDAVYVLAFSTIMLNTDLHNPMIKADQRMTKTQFIRNNRGINAGEDLPEEYVSELYDQIKAEQIQVRRELGDFLKSHEHEDFRTAWESMLARKGEVAKPFFTPAGLARPHTEAARMHDQEMFSIMAQPTLQALSGIFAKSEDDVLVVRALTGIKQVVKLATKLELDSTVNDAIQILLMQGREYVTNSITMDHSNGDGGASVGSNGRTVVSGSGEEDTSTGFESDDPSIPYGLLCCSQGDDEMDITGSATHRGLLALDSAFVLIREHGPRVTGAWSNFIECLCALRDAKSLPEGLANLDDFADSSGKVLPLSSFAKASQRRLDDYYRALNDKDVVKKEGWFRSLFKKSEEKNVDNGNENITPPQKLEQSAQSKALLSVVEAADVETVVQMGSDTLIGAEEAIKSLLDALDGYPFAEDPVQEQHAIFSLELAARGLLSNRDWAPDLFAMFLGKFERILGFVTEKTVPAPFVIERIVVTVLRSCIHLYDISELRPHLRASLHLILMTLPRSYIRQLADRVACGLAIILRASFHYFETFNDWNFMGETLDMMANYSSSRVFVFDGIASTVEFALPSPDEPGRESEPYERPILSMQACTALSRILIRFVLGFYQNDVSLQVPAMLCLEKVYRQRVVLLLQKDLPPEAQERGSSVNNISVVPDKDAWQNVAVAVYAVCRSSDPESSRQGLECYQRVILQTDMDQIAQDKWVSILYLMVNKQPPISAPLSRGNTFSALGHLLSRVLPVLSHNRELREDLYDLISQTASLARENLRQGRRGAVSPLFERTLQVMTYLSNHMMTEEWTGEPEFSSWASEELLSELERVGAAGASLKNQVAIQKRKPPPPPSPSSSPVVGAPLPLPPQAQTQAQARGPPPPPPPPQAAAGASGPPIGNRQTPPPPPTKS